MAKTFHVQGVSVLGKDQEGSSQPVSFSLELVKHISSRHRQSPSNLADCLGCDLSRLLESAARMVVVMWFAKT